MPKVAFTLRWPDGTLQTCGSPSSAIERWLCAGAAYPVAELVRRTDEGLAAAAERVRVTRGFACTAAPAQAESIRRRADAVPGDGQVEVSELARVPKSRPPLESLDGHVGVVVIGGGQAGLSVSWHLRRRDIAHVVLERHEIGHAWSAERWDAFCLVTPNFQCRLPGHPYAGPAPDGFMLRDEIVRYVRGFADSFDPPVREGVRVTGVEPAPGGGFAVRTSAGDLTADQVVLAVGGYHLPAIPRAAERLPGRITQLHSSGYRNASSLPDGAVLVVGSGQSGAQIAEDLHLAGREVHLSVGTAPRVARFYRGRDVVAWLEDMGHYDLPIDEHPEGLGARKEANHYVTGRDGGREIDLRAHGRDGLHLHGRLTGLQGGSATFGGDLAANLDAADDTLRRINAGIDRWIDRQGIDAPSEPAYEPVWTPAHDGSEPLDLEAAGISTVIWATGFASDWSWVRLPAFDGAGYPTHHRGVTSVPGLSVIGLPWLHTWGSGRFASVARDAEHLAEHVEAAARAGSAAAVAA